MMRAREEAKLDVKMNRPGFPAQLLHDRVLCGGCASKVASDVYELRGRARGEAIDVLQCRRRDPHSH